MKTIAESRISPQGQMSLPQAAREHLQVGPGDTVVWEINDRGELVARRKRGASILELRRRVFPEGVPAGGPVTNEQIHELAAEAWAEDLRAER
jgi:bifunctional DNA-binding transcriptional regulator/antitoxin component of YhaV-PrlF toxin-antitoxin module